MHEPAECEELLRRLHEDGENVLADAFTLHRERFWRLVDYRLDPRLRGRVDPEDVLQEAYIQAAVRLHHYLKEVKTSLFVWIRSITCQTLIDVHRRHLGTLLRDASREISVQGKFCSASASGSLADILAGSFTSPSGIVMRGELEEQLEKALGQMDPMDCEVLIMRHFEELSNGEVAQVLNLQPSGASMRYARALQRLKEVVSQIPGLADDLDEC